MGSHCAKNFEDENLIVPYRYGRNRNNTLASNSGANKQNNNGNRSSVAALNPLSSTTPSLRHQSSGGNILSGTSGSFRSISPPQHHQHQLQQQQQLALCPSSSSQPNYNEESQRCATIGFSLVGEEKFSSGRDFSMFSGGGGGATIVTSSHNHASGTGRSEFASINNIRGLCFDEDGEVLVIGSDAAAALNSNLHGSGKDSQKSGKRFAGSSDSRSRKSMHNEQASSQASSNSHRATPSNGGGQLEGSTFRAFHVIGCEPGEVPTTAAAANPTVGITAAKPSQLLAVPNNFRAGTLQQVPKDQLDWSALATPEANRSLAVDDFMPNLAGSTAPRRNSDRADSDRMQIAPFNHLRSSRNSSTATTTTEPSPHRRGVARPQQQSQDANYSSGQDEDEFASTLRVESAAYTARPASSSNPNNNNTQRCSDGDYVSNDEIGDASNSHIMMAGKDREKEPYLWSSVGGSGLPPGVLNNNSRTLLPDAFSVDERRNPLDGSGAGGPGVVVSPTLSGQPSSAVNFNAPLKAATSGLLAASSSPRSPPLSTQTTNAFQRATSGGGMTAITAGAIEYGDNALQQQHPPSHPSMMQPTTEPSVSYLPSPHYGLSGQQQLQQQQAPNQVSPPPPVVSPRSTTTTSLVSSFAGVMPSSMLTTPSNQASGWMSPTLPPHNQTTSSNVGGQQPKPLAMPPPATGTLSAFGSTSSGAGCGDTADVTTIGVQLSSPVGFVPATTTTTTTAATFQQVGPMLSDGATAAPQVRIPRGSFLESSTTPRMRPTFV